jgi:ABC-type dipeptide/oligopeptide/nickel transport system permease subunit
MSIETSKGRFESVAEQFKGIADIYSRFDLSAKVGLWVLIVFALMAIFAPEIAPYDQLEQDYAAFNAEPSLAHPMGSDHIGRDVFSRVVFGARISLSVGALAVIWAGGVGCAVGAVAAYKGGLLDDIVMRVSDALMAFPSIVLAIALVVIVPPSIPTVAFAVGFPYVARYARLIRGEVLSIKQEPYIEAAEGIGMADRNVLSKEILPNSFQPVLVQITFQFPLAVLAEAGLSFLGLGITPPTPSWGAMIQIGQPYMPEIWWPVVFPGMAIFFTVMAFNLIGDGVQDEWDPHTEGTR